MHAVLPVGEARHGKTCIASETANPVAVQKGVQMLSGVACA